MIIIVGPRWKTESFVKDVRLNGVPFDRYVKISFFQAIVDNLNIGCQYKMRSRIFPSACFVKFDFLSRKFNICSMNLIFYVHGHIIHTHVLIFAFLILQVLKVTSGKELIWMPHQKLLFSSNLRSKRIFFTSLIRKKGKKCK